MPSPSVRPLLGRRPHKGRPGDSSLLPRSSMQRTVAALVVCTTALVVFFQVSVVPHGSGAPQSNVLLDLKSKQRGEAQQAGGAGGLVGRTLARDLGSGAGVSADGALRAWREPWGRLDMCPTAGHHVAYWRADNRANQLDTSWHSPYPALTHQEELSRNATALPLPRFLTFEPDGGGWNNVRMALETAVIFAIATGRVLVLPPYARIYLLNAQQRLYKRHHVVNSFYRDGVYEWYTPQKYRARIAMAQVGDEITEGMSRQVSPGLHPLAVTMDDFLETYVRLLGVDKPPKPFQDFIRDGRDQRPWLRELYEWIAQARGVHLWEGSGFGPVLLHESIAAHKRGAEGMTDEEKRRMNLFGRTPKAYDPYMNIPVIHFGGVQNRGRMLTQWYGFTFFGQERHYHRMQRVARDLMRYSDSIFCRAAAAVQALGGARSYASIHVRRGDFQYKTVKTSAEVVAAEIVDLIRPNETLYISTDVKDPEFFEGMRTMHGGSIQLRFLRDFPKAFLEGVSPDPRYLKFNFDPKDARGRGGGSDRINSPNPDPNLNGMVEQIILARARVMIGTYYSTFTGFATRMRGWFAARDGIGRQSTNSREGVRGGGTETYYVPRKQRYILEKEGLDPPQSQSWPREYRFGWEGVETTPPTP